LHRAEPSDPEPDEVSTSITLQPPPFTPGGRFVRRLVRDAPAWAVSFVVHFATFLVLGTFTLLVPVRAPVTLSAVALEAEPEPVVEEYRFAQFDVSEVGAQSIGGAAGGRPEALVLDDTTQVAFEVPPSTPVADLRVFEFDKTILTAPNVTQNLFVTGVGSVGSLGAEGAIDRITHEILLSLEQRPTLVVWLFDQSGSLKQQREAIVRRFDRVYDELGIIEASGNPAFRRHDDKPLLTSVASFGAAVQLLTPRPTDDVTDIKAAVRAVNDDTSGRENVFQAVLFVADKYRRYRLQNPSRNVMIVVFTDEAGDDLASIDATIDACRKYAMPVYVVGVPAPFGRTDAYVKYIDPDPAFDQSPQWSPVHQGPESFLPERLKLTFAGENQYEEERIDSGFGPFGLCRLTSETGGLYFTVHPNRKVGERVESWETAAYSSHLGAFFDETIMRNYRPDYLHAEDYYTLLQKNAACRALVEASQLSWAIPMQDIRRRFPRVDDAQLVRDLTLAQRNAAKLEPRITAITATLRRGEEDRPKVIKPRWQAGYDLAMGRALAVQVRTLGYNAMLAQAKQGLKFRDPKNDTWILRPTGEVTLNSVLAKDAVDAKKYLDRVVAEHPGTPWALLAQQELKEPLGWAWHERFTGVAARRAERQANNNRPRRPANRVEAPPKPRRDPPAL
jgi:hypothetical protein